MEIVKKPPLSSAPLISRLDHLECIMKRLEGKQNLSKCGGSNSDPRAERQYQPLDLAMRDAYFKGSLLDRVASLESRLFQLCLELESSSTSCNSTGILGAASSSQASKKEVTVPAFVHPYQALNTEQTQPVIVTNPENQGNCNKKQQKKKHESPVKQKGKNKPNKDEKASKSGKTKRVHPNWPHIKLLGC